MWPILKSYADKCLQKEKTGLDQTSATQRLLFLGSWAVSLLLLDISSIFRKSFPPRSQKAPVAFLVRGLYLQVVSYCVALSQSFTVKVLRSFKLQCYSLSKSSSEKSVPTCVTVCSYCCLVPSRTTCLWTLSLWILRLLNIKNLQIKITISF